MDPNRQEDQGEHKKVEGKRPSIAREMSQVLRGVAMGVATFVATGVAVGVVLRVAIV